MARKLIFVLAIVACVFMGVECLAADLGPALDSRSYADDSSPSSYSPELPILEAFARPVTAVRAGLPQPRARAILHAARMPRPIAPRAVLPSRSQSHYPARC